MTTYSSLRVRREPSPVGRGTMITDIHPLVGPCKSFSDIVVMIENKLLVQDFDFHIIRGGGAGQIQYGEEYPQDLFNLYAVGRICRTNGETTLDFVLILKHENTEGE